MLTVDQVRDAKLANLKSAAEEWATGARRIGEYAARYRAEVAEATTRSGWSGPAADSARPAMAGDQQQLDAAHKEALAIARALATAVGEFGIAQRELAMGLDAADRLGVKVSPDGGVSWPPQMRNDPDTRSGPLAQQAAGVHRQINDALQKATQADLDVARDLQQDMGINADTFNGSATEGRRTDPNKILAEYQVKDDPDGTTLYPDAVTAWMFGVDRSRITKTEATMLDNLSAFEQSDFKDIRDKAWDVSDGKFSNVNGANDSHRDAFRHAYWNALMTRRYGEKWTARYASAHEQLPGNPADREAMDLYNNEVGRKIAVANPKASDEELARLIEDAVKRGDTVVVKPDGGALDYSDQVRDGKTGLSNERPGQGGKDPGAIPDAEY
ncbi:DUF6973 domain-containing protein [Kitasatospora sp. NPDC004240]